VISLHRTSSAAGASCALAVGLAVLLAPRPAAASAPPVTVTSSTVPPLRQLAAEATAAVLGDVGRTETYDEGRLLLHRIRVTRVLRGRIDVAEPAVVDILGDPNRPPLVVEGERAVFLLKPQPPLSYLDEQLPEGSRFAVVSGVDGVLTVGTDAEVEAIERALAQGAAVAALDEEPARAACRKLAFTELASPSPRLALDALTELRQLPDVKGLTPEEVDGLGRALRDPRVDPTTRMGLIRLIGERGWREALPALGTALTDSPATLDAVLAARTALGTPPTRADLRPYLEEKDPKLRAVAARALARLDDPQALGDVGGLARNDPDVKVREAAVEALGKSGKPAAIPVLRETFASNERAIRQASARALIDMPGPVGDQALVELALQGRTSEVQSYAALVLLVTRGRDSEAVRRLEQSNPSPAVRKLLEHGIEFIDKHGE
jgi:HEAT repeat protein